MHRIDPSRSTLFQKDGQATKAQDSPPIKDFEDVTQVAAAVSCGASRIVTRNLKDYERSPTPAITPRQALPRIFRMGNPAYRCSATTLVSVMLESLCPRRIGDANCSVRLRDDRCPGPDSNRQGVAPGGFSYPLRLSPRGRGALPLGSGLSLCRIAVERLRPEPSSLYTFPLPGLARDCHHLVC